MSPCSRHEAGNVGVEYASPASIRVALEGAALAFPRERKEFDTSFLMDLGLVNSFDGVQVWHGLGGKGREREYASEIPKRLKIHAATLKAVDAHWKFPFYLT